MKIDNEEAINMLYAMRAGNLNLNDLYTKKKYEALTMGIKAIEILEDFEKARIITDGRLNGRTYAYKCGLEDGKRKALEQESFKPMVEIDLYSVIKQKYIERDVLDKIRAELEEHAKSIKNSNPDRAKALCWCLDVIDKYMAESKEDNR